jgi:uncharacterized protein (UPF0332 family)
VLDARGLYAKAIRAVRRPRSYSATLTLTARAIAPTTPCSTPRVEAEFGRILNRAQEIRQVADYTGDKVSAELAAWVVEQSALFIQAMQDRFQPG